MKCWGYRIIGGYAHRAPHLMNMKECVEAGTHHQMMIGFKCELGAEMNNDILTQIQERIKQLKKK